MTMEVRGCSPTSDIFSDEVDTLSTRDKALLKRSVSKHHNTNFRAGYVPVHEQYLTKTGLRGRKTFAFWTLVGLLFVLAVGNLMLTITILGVLRLGQGMQSIELVPEAYAIKFFGNTDLGDLYKRDGKIEGFKDEPLDISAEDSSVLLNLAHKNDRPVNKVKINKNGTLLREFKSFVIKDKQGETIFTTENPHFKSLKRVHGLSAKMIHTNRIVSPLDAKLRIEGRTINLKGSEGTTMDAKQIVWSADQDIHVTTLNGSIVLSSGSKNIYLDTERMPKVTRHVNYNQPQYKICVCMPQGKLYKIPVPQNANTPVSCDQISMEPQHNPCL